MRKLGKSFTTSRPSMRKSLVDFSPKNRLSNFCNSSCQATLSFQNDTFLPLSALANPLNCPDDQIARLRIPESAPNGPAALEWYVKVATLGAEYNPCRQCSSANGVAVDLM